MQNLPIKEKNLLKLNTEFSNTNDGGEEAEVELVGEDDFELVGDL